MTPFGHLAVSYLVSRSGARLSRPACLVGGLLPDVEFVFLFMPWFNQYHRLLTHNLLFVCLVALLGAVLWRKGRLLTGASLLLCGVLHLFVDSVMDTNPGNGIGVAWFWPFSDAVLSPFNLLQAAPQGGGWHDPIAFLRATLPVQLAWELPFVVAAGWLGWRARRSA